MAGAPMAAIAAAHARNDVIEALKRRQATSAASAAMLEGLDAAPKRQLEHLVKAGLVRESAPQHYYLDERRWREAAHAQAQRLKWVLLAGVFATLVGLAFLLATL